MRSLPTDPDSEGHRQTDSSRFVRMLPLMAASLFAMATPATTGPCPASVVNQLDGLYRWEVQRMEQRVDQITSLSTQRHRFTPSLFELLLQAYKLRPSSDGGRFLGFNVFNSSQVSTFRAKVIGCSAQKASSIQAEVSVDVGLRGRPGIPRGLLYEMNKGSKGSWRINNIKYLDDGRVSLRHYLQDLLNPAS